MDGASSYVKDVTQRLREVRQASEEGRHLLGYIYPHAPLELLLAQELIPVLLWADPGVPGAFEDSLQTFCCSYARNIFSQRASGRLPPLSGILFPGNTCDSLQNVGDVWRFRFPQDRVFRLTYPARSDGAAVHYLAQELRKLSKSLQEVFHPLTSGGLERSMEIIGQFRRETQFLYAARIFLPQALPYSQLARLIRSFLTVPGPHPLAKIGEKVGELRNMLREAGLKKEAEALRQALLHRQLESRPKIPRQTLHPRLALAGGMVDPQAVASLLESAGQAVGVTDPGSLIVFDLLSFGFRTVFTPPLSLGEDSFTDMARTILSAPSEPTSQGLAERLHLLEQVLRLLSIDGLIICEQSFCDPDGFDAPALAETARGVGVPVLRLPLDPELSDRSRLEGKLQTFIETLSSS